MPGDKSRFSFTAAKRYVGVLSQQGRVQLDSDASEIYPFVRRILVFVERSIDSGLQWAGFEPLCRRSRRRRRFWRLRVRRR